MTWDELKVKILEYIDSKTGETPGEDDLSILEALDDFAPAPGISEEEVNRRIEEAVSANTAEWSKRYKDRFYSRDEEAKEVTEPEVIENKPEEEIEKSILDYEW